MRLFIEKLSSPVKVKSNVLITEYSRDGDLFWLKPTATHQLQLLLSSRYRQQCSNRH